jgi:hypothetical protein
MTQEDRIVALIERGALTARDAFCGLSPDIVANVVKHGHGELLLLVRMRRDFDDRRIMSATQLLRAPEETQELIRDVFVLSDAFTERSRHP